MSKKKTGPPETGVETVKLIKAYKGKLGQEILSGKTDLSKELVALDKHERSLSRPEPSRNPLKPRRNYTLSPEALEQRRKAAENSTGPATAEGKKASRRNAVKYGIYGSSFIMRIGRPCKSTCPKFEDCEIIKEGASRPGQQCLDKLHLLKMVEAFYDALEGKTQGVKDMMAVELAGALEIVSQMRDEIMTYGTLVREEELGEDGKVARVVLKKNPILDSYFGALEKKGITMHAWNITEQQVLKNKSDKDFNETAATIFSGLVDKTRRARSRS